MNLWKDTYPIILACGRGLAPFTEREAREMGYDIIETTDGTVVVRGAMRDVMRLNLRLRTARRVMVPLLRTECRHPDELYDDAASIDWENLLGPDTYYTVNASVRSEFVRDSREATFAVKDAIARRMRTYCAGAEPESGPEPVGASVMVHWDADEMIVFLDTTGEPLSRRGYLRMPGSEPMPEALAAACVLASGWDRKTPFTAPMCGGGAIAIEAAMIALNRAPGTLRGHFAFMSVKGYGRKIPGEKAGVSARLRFGGASPAEIWKEEVRRAREAETPGAVPPILASDIADDTMEAGLTNAIAAGVATHVSFSRCDFSLARLPPPPGIVFLDPPDPDAPETAGPAGPADGTEADAVGPAGCVDTAGYTGTDGMAGGADAVGGAAAGPAGAADAVRPAPAEPLPALYGRIGDFLRRRCAGRTGCVLAGDAALAKKIGLRPKRAVPFWNGPAECRLLVYDLGEQPEA